MEKDILWDVFFKRFKSLPEIWHVKQGYYDTLQEKVAYEKLIDLLEPIFCTKENRSCIGLGITKVKVQALRTAYWIDKAKLQLSLKQGTSYLPKLWCFEKLSFLSDENMEHVPPNNAETSPLGAAWEEEFKKLSEKQQEYANQCITMVLCLGKLNKLNENSYKCFDRDLNKNPDTNFVPRSAVEPGCGLPLDHFISPDRFFPPLYMLLDEESDFKSIDDDYD